MASSRFSRLLATRTAHPRQGLLLWSVFPCHALLQPVRRAKTETQLTLGFTTLQAVTKSTSVWSLNSETVRLAGREVLEQVISMAEAYDTAKDTANAHEEALHHAPLHLFEHQIKLTVDFGMLFFAWANAVSLHSQGQPP